MRAVKQALQVGDWFHVETHSKDRGKLDEKVAGPYEILEKDPVSFSLLADCCADNESGDHITRTPTPTGQPDSASVMPVPQRRVVSLDHEERGLEFVWETLVHKCRDEEDMLCVKVRSWGYSPEGDS